MTLLPFALPLVVAALAYWIIARIDFREIKRDMGGPDQAHAPLLWIRAGILFPVWAFVAWLDKTPNYWNVAVDLCYAVEIWATATMFHRAGLNRMRKMDWRYTNPAGNGYDGKAFRWIVGYRPDAEEHRLFYGKALVYTQRVHKTGSILFAFELVVLALSLGGAVWILNSGGGDPASPSGSTLQVLLRCAQSGLFTSIPIAP